MISERRSPGKRARRRLELPCADLDRIDATAGLWSSAGDSSSRRSALLCAAVRRAIATALTEKQREVIEAYFFEGLSQGAIAIRLGITQQVVQKRIYGAPRGGRVVGGAIQKLREALGPFVLSRSADFLVSQSNRSPGARPEEVVYEH
jgi:hypothetical protein